MELLPEHELQSGKGQVAIKSGLVAVEEGRCALGADNGAAGVNGAAVVVAGFEVGVLVSALELESGFQDFGRDVDDGGSKIAEETWVPEESASRHCMTQTLVKLTG